MPRYVALLRGVSPMNAKMSELKRCFEDAGFTNVKTVISSGNVVFDARRASESSLEKRIEAAMHQSLDRSFLTIVRSTDDLRALLATDPYSAFALPKNAKRVVTFLREINSSKLALPIKFSDAQILSVVDRDIFSAYVPGDKGPAFMRLIEKTFGTGVTTRTWETVKKCAAS
ncbi:MAG: DUF1697 domain-containing protein [Pseudomonadota bacterium]